MSETKTPTQEEAMEAAPANVKVAVQQAEEEGLPAHSKLAHILAIVVSTVLSVACAAVLADGTSVIRLKDPMFLPVATNPALKSEGVEHRLDELLGPTYGVGLHHDQSGHSWYQAGAGATLSEIVANLGTKQTIAALYYVIANDDLKHPVPFLSCNDLQKAGLAAMWLGYIACTVAGLMVIFHACCLAEGIVDSKPLAGLVWFILTAGFLVVVLLACGIYYATWTCDNPVIPSIVLADHFEYNYGFIYAIAGFLSSLLILCTQLVYNTDKKSAKPPSCGLGKVLAGVVTGVLLAVVAAMIVMGPNKAFDEKPAADPDANPCEAQKPYHAGARDHYFANVDCMKDNVVQVLEQAGANVTRGYRGQFDAGDRVPITSTYEEAGLCPVNVHWHLGAEHLSVGEFDEAGKGPAKHRQLAKKDVRLGFQCRLYDETDPKFTTPYTWQHCDSTMEVGQTYEVHWPHSAAGACGTDYQYQTPFYDGVFCHDGVITLAPLNTYKKIGVHSQVFTIVNDEAYYNANMIAGMIVDGEFGADIAKYTGSTTGTTRDNEMCSRYTPITWQVDRKCHLISASSFDKMCADMKAMKDDMSHDLHAHGSRELVADHLVADNQQSRKA